MNSRVTFSRALVAALLATAGPLLLPLAAQPEKSHPVGREIVTASGLRYTDRLRRRATGGWEVVHRRVVSVWRWEAEPTAG